MLTDLLGIRAFEFFDNVHVWVLQISAVDLEPCSRLMVCEELDRVAQFCRGEDLILSSCRIGCCAIC
jgi:hypothetical protein